MPTNGPIMNRNIRHRSSVQEESTGVATLKEAKENIKETRAFHTEVSPSLILCFLRVETHSVGTKYIRDFKKPQRQRQRKRRLEI